MSTIWRVGLRGVLVLLSAIALAPGVSAQGFAPVGAKGTPGIEIELEGQGRVDSSGAGWDGAPPVGDATGGVDRQGTGVDASRFAGLGGASQAESGDDEDREEESDVKFEAC